MFKSLINSSFLDVKEITATCDTQNYKKVLMLRSESNNYNKWCLHNMPWTP